MESVLYPLSSSPDPARATPVEYEDCDLRAEAPSGAVYTIPDAPIGDKRLFTEFQRALVDELYRTRTFELQSNKRLKLWSTVGESPEDFAQRCEDAAAAAADAEEGKLRDRYEARIARARDALAAAEDRVGQAQTGQSSRKAEEVVSGVGSVLGSILGGCKPSASAIARSLGSATSRRGRTAAAGQRAQSPSNGSTRRPPRSRTCSSRWTAKSPRHAIVGTTRRQLLRR